MSASSKLSFELFVLVPDVESHWHHVEQLAVCELAILPEIEEQCLFVAKVAVSRHVVVHQLRFCPSQQFGWRYFIPFRKLSSS